MDKIKSIPIVTLSTFGHCGIDWLHSFIDSHNEVLIIPQLSFFRKIETLKRKKIYLDNSLRSSALVNLFSKELFKKTKIKSYNILKNNQNKSNFKKYIYEFLKFEKNLDIEKRLFFATHYAFAKINKVNLNNIKIIVAHEHAPWNCYLYKKHFDAKFIFIIRDPRKSFAGSLRIYKRHKDIPINFQIDTDLLYMISAQKFTNAQSKKKIIILKNESMHKNLNVEMRKLSKWLNIKFKKSLLNETFLGKKWIGESAYLSAIDLKKPYPKDYYKPSNVEKRWRSVLDKNTILVIETIFEKIMIKYKYKFDNKLNFRSRVVGYASLLLRFNEFKNFFSYMKGLIKNIIRRIFIIYFTNKSLKIFDIA